MIRLLTIKTKESKSELEQKVQQIKKRHNDLSILSISNKTKEGLTDFENFLESGKTYCFLGSSGVGKSTLINLLLGKDRMETSEISESTGKGKHTTSHRELFILENGSMVVDTPGMREVGVMEGVEDSFDHMAELAGSCKYSDCSHTNEDGCAILDAVENHTIGSAAYNNYLRMLRETAHYSSTVAEKRRKDKKFGKIIKQVLKHKKRNKF